MNRVPSAQSLLNDKASSFAAIVMLVIVTCEALMTFQPSRLSAVCTFRWSDVMLLQPFVSIAKWPPRRSVIPETVSPSHRVSEISLSA